MLISWKKEHKRRNKMDSSWALHGFLSPFHPSPVCRREGATRRLVLLHFGGGQWRNFSKTSETSATICSSTVTVCSLVIHPPPPSTTNTPETSGKRQKWQMASWDTAASSVNCVCVCVYISQVFPATLECLLLWQLPDFLSAWRELKCNQVCGSEIKNAAVVLFRRSWMWITKLWKPRALWRGAKKQKKQT